MASGRDRRSGSGRSGSRKRAAGRAQSRRDRLGPGQPGRPTALEDQPLIRGLRAALRGEPFALVALVSSVVAAVDGDWSAHTAAGAVGLPELVDSFVGVDVAETTAALHAIAALTSDEVLAARIRRALPSRAQPVPEVVAHLGEARVTAAVLMSHELDDGDNVILTVRWPDGFEVTPVVYIDHNLGTIVKDAVVVEERSSEVLRAYRDLLARERRHPSSLEPLGLADARAKITEAILAGRAYEPEDEESQWPASRPFVQMLLRSMPSGGEPGAGRPSYPQVSPEEVVAGFLGSSEATGMVGAAEADSAAAVGLLVDYAAEHSGHPLRWSAVTAELALTRYLPWEPSVPERTLDAVPAVPAVLPALVAYSHRVLGMSAESTADTLESVRGWLGEFERLTALPSVVAVRESTAELAALLAGDPRPWRGQLLVEELGSQAAVDALDVRPLPEEELDLSAVPADVHARAREVVALTDEFAEEAGEVGWLDHADGPTLAVGGDAAHGRRLATEWRTACRRFVARVAANDPAIFRGRGRADTAAAAVVWVVGRANELVGPSPAAIPSGEAQAWFGLSGSSSQRAAPMLRAIGVDPSSRYGHLVLGTPDLLTSARRGALLRQRDAPR